MGRSDRGVIGIMAGVLGTLLAFGLVYVLRALITCSCLNS